jgi:hypothetical protein
MSEEKKSGMYGEMPKIKIGKYTIANMSNEEDCSTVWVEETENGEGGEFSKSSLVDFIDKFYKDFF